MDATKVPYRWIIMRELGTFKGLKLKENTKSPLSVLRCFLWPF